MRILVKITGLTVAVIFFVTSSISAAPYMSPLASTLRPKAEANAGRTDLAEDLKAEKLSFVEPKVKNLARQAGEIMLRVRAKKSMDKTWKFDKSIVTEADIAIEELLVTELVKLIPGSVVISEENFKNKETIERARKARYAWIVDPLDGTDLFVSRRGLEYGVAICLLDNGRPVSSIFYAPELEIGANKGCLFEASANREGAYLNGTKIRISNTTDFKNAICNIHCRDIYPPAPFEEPIITQFGNKEWLNKDFSSTARYCMLAASGDYSDFPSLFTKRNPKLWDVIPGAFIVEKAGGIVMYPDGNPVIPIDFDKFLKDEVEPRIPSNIACSLAAKDKILSIINAPAPKFSSAGSAAVKEILKDPQVIRARAEDAVRDVFRFGQVHIFEHWGELREDEKTSLLHQLKQVDFEELDRFYRDYLSAEEVVKKKQKEQIKPEQAITEEKAEREWADLADASLKKGELCVYLLAGGSGDRLGFNKPKGLLEASPLSGKTLYQIFAERVRVLTERNGRATPLIIQTSKDTYKQTLAYFERNNYFGIKGQIQIKPAVQRSLPRLDEDGKIVMTSKSSIATSGFGHGDVTDYILKNKTPQSKKLRNWLRDNFGTKYVQVIQIDNPLAPIGNKALLGTHIAARPQELPKGQLHMTYALIEKKPPTEKIPLDKMGHLAIVDGERKMLEYSEIAPKTAAKFRLGSPNVLIVSLDGIEDAPPLKPHTVKKKVSGRVTLKFESFIFDNKSCGRAVKLERNHVFAPIKNRERERRNGKVVEDSPVTSKSIQSFYYAQKLHELGWKVPADFYGKRHPEVEIYPHHVEFSDEFLMSDEARIGKNGCFGKSPGALFLSGRRTRLGDNPRINGGLYVDVEDEKRGVVEIGDNITFDGHIRIKVYGDGKLNIPDGSNITRDIIVFDGENFNYRDDIDLNWRRSYEIKRFAEIIFKTEDARRAAIEFLQNDKTIIDTDAGRMKVVMEHPRGAKDLYSVSLYRVDEDNKPQEQIGYFDFVYDSSFPDRHLHSDYSLEEVEEFNPAAQVKDGYRNKGLGTEMALFALTFGVFNGVRFHNCWNVQTESRYLNRIGYEWKKVIGEDGEDYGILSFDLRKFSTLPQREELAGKARYPDDNSAQTKLSSAGNLNENLEPIRPSLPISIKGLKADAGNGYQYPVDVNIQEDGKIGLLIHGDLETIDSCFDRYKNIEIDVVRQLRRRGFLIEEKRVPGKKDLDYRVILAPFDKVFLAPKGIVRADESIFMRDIRAKAAELSNGVCYNLGRSFATLLRESTDKKEIWVPVGGDVRNSTPRIYYYYIRGLIDSGINVYSLGTAPTPTVYFASDLLSSVGYAIITGSHNPPEDNGIKQGIAGNNLTFKQAARLKEIFFSGKYYRSKKKGKIVDARSILDTYVDFLTAYSQATKAEWEKYIINGDNLEAGINAILDIHYGETPLLNRKVAADSGNGCAGYLPRMAWDPLGAEVALLYPEADGAFPHHIPNPEEPGNLKDLIEFVRENRYDLGFAFDTDVDRLAAVDPEIITGEDIYCIIAQDMLKENPGAKMVVETKASYTLMEHIKRHGGKVVMSGVGVTNIRGAISREGAILGGETSGHIYHRDNGFRDDGLFTATALLKIMAKTGKSIRQLLSDVHYYPTSPEIRIFLSENPDRRIIPDLKKMYQDKEGYEINDIDGVRVQLNDEQGEWLGWFLVRASATEPKITVRFGGRNEDYYNRMGKELFGFLSRYEDVVEFGKYSDATSAILSGAAAIKVIPAPVTNAGSIKPSSAGDRSELEKVYTSPINLTRHIVGRQRMSESIRAERAVYESIRQAA